MEPFGKDRRSRILAGTWPETGKPRLVHIILSDAWFEIGKTKLSHLNAVRAITNRAQERR